MQPRARPGPDKNWTPLGFVANLPQARSADKPLAEELSAQPMELDRHNTRFTCHGQLLGSVPRCPGVYRFFSDDDVLLYIGKSIDIGTRLNSHFNDARDPGRQQRMMVAVVRVDCELTAGDVGAQLIENAAIKAETPLYNRRQRRSRKLWTQRLVEDIEGFLQVVPSDFSPAGERSESVFGLFRSRQQLQGALRALARDEGLCLRMLGAERGRGPCFQSQIGRCRGACSGGETAASHNARLLDALERQRIAAWPFPGPVILHEARQQRQHAEQPARQYHVINHWCYLGSFTRRDAARRRATQAHARLFDRDTYRIVYRALRHGCCEILDASATSTLANPFAGDMAALPDVSAETSCDDMAAADGPGGGADDDGRRRSRRDRESAAGRLRL